MKVDKEENSSDEEVTLVVKNLDDNSTILFNPKTVDTEYTQIGSQRT